MGLRLGIVLFVLVALVALGFANYRFADEAPGGNDFLPRWVGTHAWLEDGTSPYSRSVTLEAQRMIYGRPADPSEGEDVAQFVYPLPAIVFFIPFGLMPYTLARAVWMTLLEVCLPMLALLGLGIAKWRPKPWLMSVLVLLSILWYHGLRAVIVGQFAVIEAVLIAGAFLAVQRERDALGGILLALSLAKPQMSFLIIPYVLLWAYSRRRWAIIISTFAFLALWIGASLLIIPDWPLQWLRQILEYPAYTDIGSPVSILAGLVPPVSDWLNRIFSGALILYMFWEWYLARDQSDNWFQWTAAMTLVVTNLVAFRTATTNYVVLLPAWLLIFSVWEQRWDRRGIVASALTSLALVVGPWVLFLTTVQTRTESAVMYLPLPLLTLVGLWWIRWWKLRAPEISLTASTPISRRLNV